MSKFNVRVFSHCRQATPILIIDFDDIDLAIAYIDKLGEQRTPASLRSTGSHGRMLRTNHPNPLSHRCDWDAALLDGWA
jgi:hypothetical protein